MKIFSEKWWWIPWCTITLNKSKYTTSVDPPKKIQWNPQIQFCLSTLSASIIQLLNLSPLCLVIFNKSADSNWATKAMEISGTPQTVGTPILIHVDGSETLHLWISSFSPVLYSDLYIQPVVLAEFLPSTNSTPTPIPLPFPKSLALYGNGSWVPRPIGRLCGWGVSGVPHFRVPGDSDLHPKPIDESPLVLRWSGGNFFFAWEQPEMPRIYTARFSQPEMAKKCQESTKWK